VWGQRYIRTKTVGDKKWKKFKHKKTNKEINRRIYEIFENSNPDSVGLSDVDSARVRELLWVIGKKPTKKAERLMKK